MFSSCACPDLATLRQSGMEWRGCKLGTPPGSTSRCPEPQPGSSLLTCSIWGPWGPQQVWGVKSVTKEPRCHLSAGWNRAWVTLSCCLYLSSMYQSVNQSIHQSSVSHLPVHPSINYLSSVYSVYLHIHQLSISHLSIHHSSITYQLYVSMYLSVICLGFDLLERLATPSVGNTAVGVFCRVHDLLFSLLE